MNKRLSKEKQALVLSALCEGTPVNAVARMFHVGKHAILRVIRETGEAFADHMDKNFRDLPCIRIEMDEQWQYVGCHEGRMSEPDKERGSFWLWACIDADTKLVFSHKIGKRDWITGHMFVKDVSERVSGPVQIATDNLPAYPFHIRTHFGYEGYSYGTETKIFGEPELLDGTLARLGKNEGVRKMRGERGAERGPRGFGGPSSLPTEPSVLTFLPGWKGVARNSPRYARAKKRTNTQSGYFFTF